MKICSSRKKNNWWWYTSSLNYTCGQITHLFFQLSGFSFRGRQLFSRFRLILFTTHAKYEWTLYSERDRESSSPPNESFDQIKLTLLVWDASSRICNLKLEHSLLFHLCRGRVETTLEGFISDFVFINWPLTSSLSSVSVSGINSLQFSRRSILSIWCNIRVLQSSIHRMCSAFRSNRNKWV